MRFQLERPQPRHRDIVRYVVVASNRGVERARDGATASFKLRVKVN
jgi:hypothetical protein